MTPSINRQARMRIANQPVVMKEFPPKRCVPTGGNGQYVYRPFTKHQLGQAATTLDALADFWAAHPERWIKGTSFSIKGGGRMCNIGVLGVANGRYDKGHTYDYATKGLGGKPSMLTASFKKATTKAAVTFTEAHVDFLINLNDNATTLDENIAGLRYAAQAYRYHAEGMEWNDAVDKAWSQNTKLLKVQIQRYGKQSPGGAKYATLKLEMIGAK